MNTLVNHEFDVKELVYLITEDDQSLWQICGITFFAGGHVTYKLSSGTTYHTAYEFELTREKTVK